MINLLNLPPQEHFADVSKMFFHLTSPVVKIGCVPSRS
nr:MAG TPA: hypothetical protein [Caudoviricetes sp.]